MKLRVQSVSISNLLIPVFAACIWISWSGTCQAQGNQNFDKVQIQVQHVQGSVYMLTGAGGNTTVQAGPDGVLVVDTQFAPMAPKILTAIWQLSNAPIRYIINTHAHRDH